MNRFCPQCGDRVAYAQPSQKDRRVDAEGFCAPFGARGKNVNGRGRAWRADGEEREAPVTAGCVEHLRRFDPETGERIEKPASTRFVDPWSITTGERT